MRLVLLLGWMLAAGSAAIAQEAFPFPNAAFGGGLEMGRAPGEFTSTGAAIFDASVEAPLIGWFSGYLRKQPRFGVTDLWGMDARAGNFVIDMIYNPLGQEGSVDSRFGLAAFFTTGGSPEESKGIRVHRVYRNSFINRIGPDWSGLEYGILADLGSVAIYADRMTDGRRFEIGIQSTAPTYERVVAWDYSLEQSRMPEGSTRTGYQWAFKIRARLYPL